MASPPAIVAENLTLREAQDQVTDALTMEDSNAAAVGLIIKSLVGSSATVRVSLEEGNELDNWKTVGPDPLITGTSVGASVIIVGPIPSPSPSQVNLALGSRFLRLRVNLSVSTGTGAAVVRTGAVRGFFS